MYYIEINSFTRNVHCVEADDRGIYNGHHKMADPKESKFCFDSFSRSVHIFVWHGIKYYIGTLY